MERRQESTTASRVLVIIFPLFLFLSQVRLSGSLLVALRLLKGEPESDVAFVDGCRAPQLQIMLVNTKVPRSTKTLVANVRLHHNEVLDHFEAILISVSTYHRTHH